MNEVGLVIGTRDSQPLEFWVGVSPESYLQLDDIVAVTSQVPERGDPSHPYCIVARAARAWVC